jgi:NADH dehydrogenase
MKQIANIPITDKKRIVIIGGGFAGIKLAIKLQKSNFQIVLIDKRNYHQFQPLLYQVATAGLEPTAISFPLRKLFQKHYDLIFRVGALKEVNPITKQIYTNIGNLSFDYLVIATGAQTNFFNMKNIKKYALPLKSPSDAILIRNVILENYEEALNHTSTNCINTYLNIAIVGGGPTGVELAGALAEMKKFILPKDYPDLDFSSMRIFLFESGSALLKNMSFKSSKKAYEYLKNLGVDVRLNTFVSDYDGKIVKLSNGESHMTYSLIWVAGIKMGKIQGLSADSYGRSNDLLVDEYNRVLSYSNIFAIGDVATHISEKYPQGYPKVVQTAIQQADLLSKNLINLRNRETLQKFRYKNNGTMVTIGRNLAVADLPKFHLSGFFAWITWSLVHLFSIIGLKNKIITFINWSWNYFTYNQSLRLLIKPKSYKVKKREILEECHLHEMHSQNYFSSEVS